jgi:hypothetical protein
LHALFAPLTTEFASGDFAFLTPRLFKMQIACLKERSLPALKNFSHAKGE